MRRCIRLLGVVGCAVLGAAAMLPAAALAQRAAPSAEQLWNEYPLQQGSQGDGANLAAASPTAAPSATPQPAPLPARPAERGSPWVLLLIAAAFAAASGPFVLPALRRRRERRSRPAHPASATPAGASRRPNEEGLATPSNPSSLGSAPGATVTSASGQATTSRPPDPRRPWAAEIEWCEAGGEWRFRVLARTPGGEAPSTVVDSPPLEWPPSSETAVEALTRAAERLEAVMVAAGWKALAPGDAWYAKRFAWEPVRTVQAHPTPLPAPAPAEAPPPQSPGPGAAGATGRRVRERSRPVHRTGPERARPVPRPGPGRLLREDRKRAEPAQKPGRFNRTSTWPAGSEAAWRCEIQLESAYGKSRLRAVAFPPHSKAGHTIGTSGRFQWVHGPDEKQAADVQTAEALAAALVQVGWERVGHGAQWYAHRFLWHHEEKPADHVEPDRTQAGR